MCRVNFYFTEKVHKPRQQVQLDARRPEEDIRRDMENMNLNRQDPSETAEDITMNSERERVSQTRNHVGADVLIGFPTVQGM